MSQTVKILVFADLHGRMPQILTDEEYDFIICPGDICLDNSRGMYSDFFTLKEEDPTLTFAEFLETHASKNSLDLEKESHSKGREILEYLNSLGKKVFLVPGNWDPTQYCDGIQKEEENIWNTLIQGLDNIIDCEYQKVDLEEFSVSVIGSGSTSAPEIIHKEMLTNKLQQLEMMDLDEEEFEDERDELHQRYLYQKGRYEELVELFQNIEKNHFTIYISHNAPFKTPLDKIDNERSPAHGEHYGSIIARDLIEKFEPQLVVCGHIHEGVGVCKIQNSVCLNAGFGELINHVITLDLEKKVVKEIKKIGENQRE